MFVRLLPFTFMLAIMSHPAAAVNFQVQTLCSDALSVESEFAATTTDSVGSVTIKALDDSGVRYTGSAEGISSIGDSPSGDKAMEIISSTHMRAYGWCYSVNGIEPASMPDQVKIASNDDIIRWYYGYAEYKDGTWVTYCTPTHQARPAYICPAESSESE